MSDNKEAIVKDDVNEDEEIKEQETETSDEEKKKSSGEDEKGKEEKVLKFDKPPVEDEHTSDEHTSDDSKDNVVKGLKKTSDRNNDDKTSEPDTIKKTVEKVDYSSITLKEGSKLTGDDLNNLKSVADKIGLTAEQAKGALNYAETVIESREVTVAKEKEAKIAEWSKQVLEDPEIGRHNYNETKELAEKAYDKYVPLELQDAISDLGLDRNVNVLRFLKNLGQMTKDDSYVSGSPTLSDNATPYEIEEKRFHQSLGIV